MQNNIKHVKLDIENTCQQEEDRKGVIPLKKIVAGAALLGVAAVVVGTIIKVSEDVKDYLDDYDEFDDDFDFDDELDLDEGQEQVGQEADVSKEEPTPQSDEKAVDSKDTERKVPIE